MDTCDPRLKKLRGERIVLGGGGMLHPWPWRNVVEPLLRNNNTVIAWGIGHHHDGVHTDGGRRMADWRGSELRMARDYDFSRFALVGLRDRVPGHTHVPCVTCMHPALDIDSPPRHEVVIYEHGALDPIRIDAGPRLKNTGAHSMETVLDHLRSGHMVITNSFHGAYWAQLLGRRVLVYEPWCSKFWLMQPRPVFCTEDNWQTQAREAEPTPGLLAQCRAANRSFAHSVEDTLRRAGRPRAWLRRVLGLSPRVAPP